jgi:lysophospholipase L1-like esterase
LTRGLQDSLILILSEVYALAMKTTLTRRLIPLRIASAVVLSLVLLSVGAIDRHSASALWAQTQVQAPRTSRDWEPTIRKFEDSDKSNPPKPGSIVFTGSSSIVRWSTLADDMKPLEVVNRAFGGSQYSDVDQYAKRIVNVYHPPAVVVYAGDNDLAANSPKTPESVANDFKQFVQIVHSDLPDTWIYVMAIKPSKLRWDQWGQMKAADQMIQDFCRTQPRVQYIDVATPMFAADGSLPTDLFVADGLHPTPKLYAMWTTIIRPILLERFDPGAKASAK